MVENLINQLRQELESWEIDDDYIVDIAYSKGKKDGLAEFRANLDIIETHLLKTEYIIKKLIRKINKNK